MTDGKDEIIAVLGKGGVFDITTTGRKSGQARRLEIGYHVIDGRLYISGMPMPTQRVRTRERVMTIPRAMMPITNNRIPAPAVAHRASPYMSL